MIRKSFETEIELFAMSKSFIIAQLWRILMSTAFKILQRGHLIKWQKKSKKVLLFLSCADNCVAPNDIHQFC